MSCDDITQATEIDLEAFPTMLPPTNYGSELKNQLAHYLVALNNNRIGGEMAYILGLAGFWVIAGEATYQCGTNRADMDELLASKPGDMETRLRAWMSDKQLSGDVITEQNIHTLDVMNWIMEVPDVWRARYITNQVAEWDRQGTMPRLVLICLPDDHTSGTSHGAPTPAACVADNDLAFGQIVQAFSHFIHFQLKGRLLGQLSHWSPFHFQTSYVGVFWDSGNNLKARFVNYLFYLWR
jgi:hypothetical protein